MWQCGEDLRHVFAEQKSLMKGTVERRDRESRLLASQYLNQRVLEPDNVPLGVCREHQVVPVHGDAIEIMDSKPFKTVVRSTKARRGWLNMHMSE